jgi:flagellar hook-associated protein FlgK
MINSNYSYGNATRSALNSIADAQSKLTDSVQKIASGDVNIVEQLLQNKQYTQQVQAASKVIESENDMFKTLIDIMA